MKLRSGQVMLLAAFSFLLGVSEARSAPAASGQNAVQASSSDAGSDGAAAGSSTGAQLATSELLRIEQESQQLNQRLSALVPDVAGAREAEEALAVVARLKPNAEQICARDPAERDRFYSAISTLIDGARRFASHRPGPWASHPGSAEEFCRSPDYPAAVVAELEAQLGAMHDAEAERSEVEARLAKLGERRDEVLREMTKDLAGTSVAYDIPWLMLIMFGVGAATLAGLKLFDSTIQQELVASGQIVQFVTIVILLGVILALGLAQRLQAETLGTLLGGLAGYVLSQGVGRQAKQQALNELKTAAAMVAPPAASPPSDQTAQPKS